MAVTTQGTLKPKHRTDPSPTTTFLLPALLLLLHTFLVEAHWSMDAVEARRLVHRATAECTVWWRGITAFVMLLL